MSYPFYPLPLAPIIFLLGLPQSLLKSWPLLLRLLSTTDAYTQGCINTTCWVYLRGREFRADPLALADLSGVLSLESTVYTSLVSHSLPVALQGGAGIMGFPPSTWASWLLTLCGPCLEDHCWFFFHRCSFIVIYTGHSRGCVGAGHLKDSSSLYFDQLGKFINALSPSKKKEREIWFDLIWFGAL